MKEPSSLLMCTCSPGGAVSRFVLFSQESEDAVTAPFSEAECTLNIARDLRVLRIGVEDHLAGLAFRRLPALVRRIPRNARR